MKFKVCSCCGKIEEDIEVCKNCETSICKSCAKISSVCNCCGK